MWNIKSVYLLNSVHFVFLFYFLLLNDMYGEIIYKNNNTSG